MAAQKDNKHALDLKDVKQPTAPSGKANANGSANAKDARDAEVVQAMAVIKARESDGGPIAMTSAQASQKLRDDKAELLCTRDTPLAPVALPIQCFVLSPYGPVPNLNGWVPTRFDNQTGALTLVRPRKEIHIRKSGAALSFELDKRAYEKQQAELKIAAANNEAALQTIEKADDVEVAEIGALYLEKKRLQKELAKPFASPHADAQPDVIVLTETLTLKLTQPNQIFRVDGVNYQIMRVTEVDSKRDATVEWTAQHNTAIDRVITKAEKDGLQAAAKLLEDASIISGGGTFTGIRQDQNCKDCAWAAHPDYLTIGWPTAELLDSIQFKLYDGDDRTYTYSVECSVDGSKWLPLHGPNATGKSTQRITFVVRPIKALRFRGTNTANDYFHLYGLRIFSGVPAAVPASDDWYWKRPTF